jgi:hypothetical protein
MTPQIIALHQAIIKCELLGAWLMAELLRKELARLV